jgi:hypothetical protein
MHKIGGLLTTSEFKKKVKAAEKAIDETGKRRWDEWRRVRQLRVEKGELEELSIDRGGELVSCHYFARRILSVEECWLTT